MGKLAEYLKSEADSIRKEKAKRQTALREWLEMLETLFRQIDEWLAASDPEGLIDRSAATIEISDPALGIYKAPIRRITLGDRSIEIVPVARYVAMVSIRPPGEKPVRAQGLVELRDPGGQRYNLFQSPGGKWYIQHEPGPKSAMFDNDVAAFDAERFESALASLLR